MPDLTTAWEPSLLQIYVLAWKIVPQINLDCWAKTCYIGGRNLDAG